PVPHYYRSHLLMFHPPGPIDHIEMYVGNARLAAHFYRAVFGMRLVAYQGPETGIYDRASYIVEQQAIRLVLTTALRPNHPIADHVYRNGDSIHGVGLLVNDAKAVYSHLKHNGAHITHEPAELRDERGLIRLFGTAGEGETIHTFVERISSNGWFLPG